MSNVINFGNRSKVETDNYPPEKLIEHLIELPLEGFVVAGWLKDGSMITGSTYADGTEILWLLESFKRDLFESIEG